MSMYKFSSQFTDFIQARSKNPDKILNQVAVALDGLKEKNFPLPARDQIAAFHEGDVSDDEMYQMLDGGPGIRKRTLKQMYQVLGNLAGSGSIDMITRRVIERFLNTNWEGGIDAKFDVPDMGPAEGLKPVVPGVVRRERRKDPVEQLFVADREKAPSWQRNEDTIDWKKKKDSSVVILLRKLAEAGVLDRVETFEYDEYDKFASGIKERDDRMQIRRLKMARLLG